MSYNVNGNTSLQDIQLFGDLLLKDDANANKIIFESGILTSEIGTDTLTANRIIKLPDKDGTVLLTRARNYYCTIFGSGTNSGLTQNVYVPMNVTTTQANNRGGLSQSANGRILFTNSSADHIDFLVCFYTSIKSNANNVSASVKLYLNGVTPLNYSIVSNTMVTSPDVEFFAISTEIDMVPNDYIECWITNTSGTQNLIINNYSLTVTSLEVFNY